MAYLDEGEKKKLRTKIEEWVAEPEGTGKKYLYKEVEDYVDELESKSFWQGLCLLPTIVAMISIVVLVFKGLAS